MKKQLLIALAVAGLPCAARAQVSISTTAGTMPDASAMLDVSSTTKGLLPPRMTQAQRTAIAAPATGLVVYQTDGTAGLYCNSGTPITPAWQQLTAQAAAVYGHYSGPINQVITSTTGVTYDLTTLNAASGLTFNATADEITVAVPGVYRISYNLLLVNQTAGTLPFETQLRKNGATLGPFGYATLTNSIYQTLAVEGLYALVAGDVINLRVRSLSGSTVGIYSGTMTFLLVN